MDRYCSSLVNYSRRRTVPVTFGPVTIGSGHPVAVQTMTDTPTADTEACLRQIGRIYETGGRIVRLTTQGNREAEALEAIARGVREACPEGVALVADVHFVPQVAYTAALYADKVRINPGNYNDRGADFGALVGRCRSRGVALRIGVNHGSLSRRVTERYGDTPEGMCVSAMEFLEECRRLDFHNVAVSMKSSNVTVMVHAYRLLAARMAARDMEYPVHLGVTEAGDAQMGRIKSAVGIGALLSDGIGDTVRVSLTEAPENEIPVGLFLTRYLARRSCAPVGDELSAQAEALFPSFVSSRLMSDRCGRLGGGSEPLLWSEMTQAERDGAVVIEALGDNPVGEWRRAVLEMRASGNRRPVVLRRDYGDASGDSLLVMASADMGVMFIDGLADGLDIVSASASQKETDSLSMGILQAARARIGSAEYIACPGCGRTMYDLQGALARIRLRTSHLKGLRIGVMGCIVNGPGEMADADYGYVGAGRGRVSLYRRGEPVMRNIPEEQALDALESLIRSDGLWRER